MIKVRMVERGRDLLKFNPKCLKWREQKRKRMTNTRDSDCSNKESAPADCLTRKQADPSAERLQRWLQEPIAKKEALWFASLQPLAWKSWACRKKKEHRTADQAGATVSKRYLWTACQSIDSIEEGLLEINCHQLLPFNQMSNILHTKKPNREKHTLECVCVTDKQENKSEEQRPLRRAIPSTLLLFLRFSCWFPLLSEFELEILLKRELPELSFLQKSKKKGIFRRNEKNFECRTIQKNSDCRTGEKAGADENFSLSCYCCVDCSSCLQETKVLQFPFLVPWFHARFEISCSDYQRLILFLSLFSAGRCLLTFYFHSLFLFLCFVFADKLYFLCLRAPPRNSPSFHFFCVDNFLHYEPFFADFGPLSIGQLYRFCVMLDAKIKVPGNSVVLFWRLFGSCSAVRCHLSALSMCDCLSLSDCAFIRIRKTLLSASSFIPALTNRSERTLLFWLADSW